VRHSRALLLTLACLAVVAATVAGLARARSGASSDGVVVITTQLGFQGGAAAGTGMVLTSSGRVLTNNHVIAGATSVRVTVPKTHRSYSAHVVGYDVADDVAVLKLDGASGLATVTRGSSSSVAVGDTVTAVGNAGGSGSITTSGGKVTRIGETISVRDDHGRVEELTDLIQASTRVQPGDSGGALLDGNGRVVGMITAASGSRRFRFDGASSNAAFAIRIAKASEIAQQIVAGRRSAVVHIGPTAFLGVSVGAVDGSSPATSGALIAGVVPDGPADSAGLAAGDVITTVAGKPVAAPSDISTILLTKKPGARIAVAYVERSGARHTATVTLGSGPPQ
jgi:S1-C subfamily serine protease